MSEVTTRTPHHELATYVAAPPGDGPWPGVVILHDALGMGAVVRGHADRLAEKGFITAAPDLYSWGGRIRCVRATVADIAAGRGAAFDDVNAVGAWLAARSDCTGKIGVIGFCLTGGFALLLALGGRFSAASINYGRVPKSAGTMLRDACPIVGSFGGRDMALRGAAARLERALDRLEIDHDIKEYPGSGHSFLEDHRSPLTLVLRLTGGGYNEADAVDAWARIDEFFLRHLT